MKILNKKTGKIIDIDYIELYNSDVQFYAGSISELNEDWEDYEPDETKRYRLLKDLPTFKAGEIFVLENTIEQQGLFRESDDIMAYHQKTLMKFPNILTDWFEEIKPAEPLIKNEKVRKAVRAWADAEGETQVQVTHCRKHLLTIWAATKDNGNIDFDCDIEPFDEGFYNVVQLCGEEK